jgi:NMD protein affecting ribosome stability and mRNA decay
MWCPICGKILSGKVIQRECEEDNVEEDSLENYSSEDMFLYCSSCGYGCGDSILDYDVERNN